MNERHMNIEQMSGQWYRNSHCLQCEILEILSDFLQTHCHEIKTYWSDIHWSVNIMTTCLIMSRPSASHWEPWLGRVWTNNICGCSEACGTRNHWFFGSCVFWDWSLWIGLAYHRCHQIASNCLGSVKVASMCMQRCMFSEQNIVL